MALSDREIKYLLEKANLFRQVKGDDITYLEQALDCFNQIIKNVPPHPHYYSERAEVKSRLSRRLVRDDLLDAAIDDINKAIELDADKGWYYNIRASYLWDKLGEGLANEGQLLRDIISDYKACLSRQPTEADAWLDLIAVNIISSKYDEAISLYGQCKPYINNKENQLSRSCLGCIAFIFAGDPLEQEDTEPLYDQSIRLDNMNSRDVRVSTFLGNIRGKSDYKEKWDRAAEIDKLFVGHYTDYCNRADMYRELGFKEEALILYEKAIELNPNHFLAWNSKSSLLRKLKRYEDALKSIGTTLKLRPDNANLWNLLGNVHWDMHNHEEAIKAYDRSIELNPNDFWPWRNKGLLLDNLKRYEEALLAYEIAIKLRPYRGGVWVDKSHVLCCLGRYEEALEAANEAIKLEPGNASAWNNIGVASDRIGRYEEALSAYDKATQLYPKDFNAWRNKGLLLKKRGRYEEAIGAFEKAIEINPNHHDPWNDKGTVLEDSGSYEEAIKFYEKAIEFNPDFTLAKNNKNRVLEKISTDLKESGSPQARKWYIMGRGLYDKIANYHEAIAAFDKAIEIDPAHYGALDYKARCLKDLGRYEEAVKTIDRIIGLTSGLKAACDWYTKGECLYNLKRYEEAIEAFDKAILIDPELGGAWYQKRQCLHELKRYEEVIKVFDAFLEINPKDSGAWYNKGKYLSDELKRFDEAVAAFDKSMALHPEDSGAPYCKAECLIELRRYKEAVSVFDKLIEQSPKHPWAWYQKGKCLLELKNQKDALNAFTKAIDSWSDHPQRAEMMRLINDNKTGCQKFFEKIRNKIGEKK